MSQQTEPLNLVVDDNEMNRDMLSRRLGRQGFATELAENGEVAIEMMRNKSYALVLLDVMMPRMNGYEVLETVKSDEELKVTPIIMISAVDDLDSVVKCIELGADDYLFKPFNPILLKARVRASLRRAASAENTVAKDILQSHIDQLATAVAAFDSEVQVTSQFTDLQDKLDRLQNLLKD